MEKFVAVRAWTPGAAWHLVPEQYRLDLAVSMCGVDNGESWDVHNCAYELRGDSSKICTPCLQAILVARGE